MMGKKYIEYSMSLFIIVAVSLIDDFTYILEMDKEERKVKGLQTMKQIHVLSKEG